MTSAPVDVVLCTKGRTATVGAAVASILADPNPELRLIVVDQNDDDRLVTVPGILPEDARLSHVATPSLGLGDARNIGIRLTSAEVICFTDDDCVVPAGWTGDLVEALGDAAMVFGTVEAVEPERAGGFTPDFSPDHSIRWTGGANLPSFDDLGIGANMAVRRGALEAVHGFDPLLGAGARFPSAEDRDLALRLLRAGHDVTAALTTPVHHDGFRSGRAARTLVSRDFVGIGAMFGKLDRLDGGGHSRRAVRHLVRDIGRDLRRGHLGATRKLIAFGRGRRAAARVEIDESGQVFVPDLIDDEFAEHEHHGP